jgi:hypothetical protein
MKSGNYVNVYGESIALDGLDGEERALLGRLQRRAREKPGWCEFRNYAMNAVGEFYDARGVSRKKSLQSPLYRVARDLIGRLGIAEGKVEPPRFDYRGQLERLVLQFPTRAAFCKAAGISRDMLSHVLAGRKDLSLESLDRALARLGYRMSFVPAGPGKRTG